MVYLIVYYIPLLTGTMALLIGSIATGCGSFATFWLTSKYVTKITYNPLISFLLGAFAFIINELFLTQTLSEYIYPYYDIEASLASMFAGAFLLWQFFVGTALSYAALKSIEQEDF